MIKQILIYAFLALLIAGCASQPETHKPQHSYLKSEPSDWFLPPLLVLGDTALHPPQPHDTLNHSDFVPFDVLPSVVSKVQPVYPRQYLVDGQEAHVYVRVWISPEGYPLQAVVFKSTNANFDSAAAEAAMKWTFKAPILKGNPVSTWITIPFGFHLVK